MSIRTNKPSILGSLLSKSWIRLPQGGRIIFNIFPSIFRIDNHAVANFVNNKVGKVDFIKNIGY